MLQSHPSWVRGLKLTIPLLLRGIVQSHPSWVRGLKPPEHRRSYPRGRVAPFVGAWIETSMCETVLCGMVSHPSWVRGLKHEGAVFHHGSLGRTLRGCVD